MTKKAAGLPGTIATKVGKQCDDADVSFVEGRFLEAAASYEKALKMLPAPRERWESGREISKCVGEAYLAAGDAKAATKAFRAAKKYKGSEDDEALVELLRRVNAAADRSRARAAKKATARRRPSRRSSAPRAKKKTKKR